MGEGDDRGRQEAVLDGVWPFQGEESRHQPAMSRFYAMERTNEHGADVWGGRHDSSARIWRRRSPLKITMREAPISAATAIHRVAYPGIASARNSALVASDSVIFCFTARTARRPRAMAKGSLLRSSAIRATSAVSRAWSVPAAPIAMPMLDAASAGASLTPSPTMATSPYRRGGGGGAFFF